MKHFFLFGLFLFVNGCAYTDPGSGSGTLQVTGTVSYAAGDTDTSNVEFTIIDNTGARLSGATVTLTDDVSGDTFTATEENVDDAPGVYTTTINKYRRRLVLSIAKDSHSLDAKLEGPGPHTIASPSFGQSVKRSDVGESLKVTWETTDGLIADHVTLELDNNRFLNTLEEDSGEGEIPAAKLNDGPEGVTVKRRNRLIFAEGLNDSTFEIAYSVRHTIQVQD